MPRKYLRITEVTKICGVDVKFVKRLEQEQVDPSGRPAQ